MIPAKLARFPRRRPCSDPRCSTSRPAKPMGSSAYSSGEAGRPSSRSPGPAELRTASAFAAARRHQLSGVSKRATHALAAASGGEDASRAATVNEMSYRVHTVCKIARTPPPQPCLTLNCARAAGALPDHAGRPEAGSWPRRAPPDLLDTTTTRRSRCAPLQRPPPDDLELSPQGARCCGAARRVGGLPVRIFAREKKCRHRTRRARPRDRKTAETKISSSRRPCPPRRQPGLWSCCKVFGRVTASRLPAPATRRHAL